MLKRKLALLLVGAMLTGMSAPCSFADTKIFTDVNMEEEAVVAAAETNIKKGMTVDSTVISLTDQKIVHVVAKFEKPVADKADIAWEFGGKSIDKWFVTECSKLEDGESEPKETDRPFITVKNLKLSDDKLSLEADLSFDLPYGTDKINLRPFPRRYYYDMLGEHELKVKNTKTGEAYTKMLTYKAYDSHTLYEAIKGRVNDIKAQAINKRYVEYRSMGESQKYKKEIPMVIVAEEKSDIDFYFNTTLPKMLEKPTELLKELEKGTDKYKPVLWFNNIHSDEANGTDAQLDILEAIATQEKIVFKTTPTGDLLTETSDGKMVSASVRKDLGGTGYNKDYYGWYENDAELETVTIDVKELLDNYIIVFGLVNNPDGRIDNTRTLSTGFDPNRDAFYQTQHETQVVYQEVGKWSPMIFCDFHGFVEDFLVEPCTPPHEPNVEYDLFLDGALPHAKALGSAGVSNIEDEVDSNGQNMYDHFIIPYYDYVDGWDDAAPIYSVATASLHGAITHTIEVPELNQRSSDLFKFAAFGSLNYALENKAELFKNQVTIFERGVNGTDVGAAIDNLLKDAQGNVVGRPRGDHKNFFPEYYVIPIDEKLQKNTLEAYEIADFLEKNDVKMSKLTTDVKVGDVTYPAGSFVIDMHQAKRGFANAALYNGQDSSSFEAMYAEVTANFTQLRGFDRYEVRVADAFKGKLESVEKIVIPSTTIKANTENVVIENSNNHALLAVNDLLKSGKEVYMTISDGKNFDKGDFIVKKADLEGIKGKYFLETEAFAEKAEVKELSKVKVYADSSSAKYVVEYLGFETTSLDKADVIVSDDVFSEDMIKAMKKGKDSIAIGGDALSSLVSEIEGFEIGGYTNYYEGIMLADLDNDSVVLGGYEDKDYLSCNVDIWIEKAPKDAKILANICNTDDFYLAGWWPNHDVVKGKAFIMQTEVAGADFTAFANHITNKAHNENQFRMLGSAIFDGQEGKTESMEGKAASNAVFNDVAQDSWYAGAVNFVVENGIMFGMGDNNFQPNTKTNRAMIVAMLYRMEGEPSVNAANFSDVKTDDYFANAVAWAQANGVVTGYENNTFRPTGQLTREQLACFLYRYAEHKNVDTTKKGDVSKFADNTKVSAYAQDAISWAVGNGIINGKNGKLAPQDTATRAEVATMIQNASKLF